MGFFIQADEAPGPAVRRIAREQLERAHRELRDPALRVGARVHQLRKRCKKLRGLVRLVRDDFDAYSDVNAQLRALAAGLADHRDARVMLELSRALDGARGPDAGDAASPLRRWLAVRCEIAETDAVGRLERAEASLVELRAAVECWSLDEVRGASVQAGLERTHRRLRHGARRAARVGDARAFHRWRKRCKYHVHQLRLIAPVAAGDVRARRKRLDALADRLGDAHDISVLIALVAAAPSYVRDASTTRLVVAEARRQRRALRARALATGRDLSVEPDALPGALLGQPFRLRGPGEARRAS